MRIGLTTYNQTASDLVELARAADEAGFDDLWLGEHIVLPVEYKTEHPTAPGQDHKQFKGAIIDPETKLVDPLVAMAGMAAVTSRIKLATGIYLVGLRHPLISARMTATLHDLSHGRLVLGVGSGWLEEEFAALNVPFAERRARYEEALEVLRLAWAGGAFRHEGRFFPFELVQVSDVPLHIPLILGGNTEPALRRAARFADGWFASGTPSLDDSLRLRDRLTELYAATGRTQPFPVWVRVSGKDPEVLARYEAEGFEHVLLWANQFWPEEGDVDVKRAALFGAAAELGVRPR